MSSTSPYLAMNEKILEFLNADPENAFALYSTAVIVTQRREIESLRERVRELEAPPDPADRLLSVEEVAKILGVTGRWVRDHQDKLPRTQLPGRLVRFSESRLKAWVQRRST